MDATPVVQGCAAKSHRNPVLPIASDVSLLAGPLSQLFNRSVGSTACNQVQGAALHSWREVGSGLKNADEPFGTDLGKGHDLSRAASLYSADDIPRPVHEGKASQGPVVREERLIGGQPDPCEVGIVARAFALVADLRPKLTARAQKREVGSNAIGDHQRRIGQQGRSDDLDQIQMAERGIQKRPANFRQPRGMQVCDSHAFDTHGIGDGRSRSVALGAGERATLWRVPAPGSRDRAPEADHANRTGPWGHVMFSLQFRTVPACGRGLAGQAHALVVEKERDDVPGAEHEDPDQEAVHDRAVGVNVLEVATKSGPLIPAADQAVSMVP